MTTRNTRRNGPATGTLRVVGVFLGVATAFALTTQSARAVLLAYEGFAYDAGSSIPGQIGGFGFANAWQSNNSGAGSSSVTVSGSLGYTDGTGHMLYTSGNSALFSGSTTANSSATPNRDLFFARGTNGTDGVTTWMSMLIYRQGQATTNVSNPYPRGATLATYLPGAEKLGIGMNSGAPTNAIAITYQGNVNNMKPTPEPFSQLNFVVVRIDHVTGANDNAYIWVNPANLSVTPDVSTALTNSIGQFDFSFNRLQLFAGGNDAGNNRPAAVLALDEVRLGTEFADVTPWIPGTVPEPSVVVLSSLGGLTVLLLRRRRQ